jgi:hypothetical protein
MTDKTVRNEHLTQVISGTVEHWQTIFQCLLCLQMALSAMSVLDNVKDVQHVADNAPIFLVFENHLWGPIESFCILNLKMPDLIVSLGMTFAKFPYCGSLWVVRGGFF